MLVGFRWAGIFAAVGQFMIFFFLALVCARVMGHCGRNLIDAKAVSSILGHEDERKDGVA